MGGICGSGAGLHGGTVILSNMYATGQITHQDSGGLIGSIASGNNVANEVKSLCAQ